eukprot:5223465-Karenia_brevis.AAC.1
MLKDVPRRSASVTHPADTAAIYGSGKFVDNNPGINLGTEHVSAKRSYSDLTTVLSDISMTSKRWTICFHALVSTMPDDIIEEMWEYAKQRPSRRRAWKAAWEEKIALRTA